MWSDADSIADRERFLHWEVAFPGVWRGWQDDPSHRAASTPSSATRRGTGLSSSRRWSGSRSALPGAGPGPNRGGAAGPESVRLRAAGATLWRTDFDGAKRAGRPAQGQLWSAASGHYPLLGGGDINLYSLFVERAMGLVKPDGFVGLLTPSGIYADKTAAKFFKSVSTNGRVSGLFDFENKRLGTDLPSFFQGRSRVGSSSVSSSSAARSGASTRPSAPSSCTIPIP